MTFRSLLFVPGDSERKFAKASAGPADVLILDLEDSVSPERIDIARGMVREALLAKTDRSRQQLWVRINPLSTPLSLPDLVAVMPGRPDGILLPKTDSADEVVLLGHYLTALESREGHPPGSTRILPVATETPAAMFALGSYAKAGPRLAGVTWGAEDLATAVGASTNRDDDGTYALTFRLARTFCLLAARAAGVVAVDTIVADFRDSAALEADVRRARRDGFGAKMAIHPDQVELINAGFLPDAGEIAFAQRVIAAFEAGGGAGAVQIDGKMLDKPHLKQALNVLAAAGI
ncbi:CoA ester lyase [soil metagenome]